MEVVVLSDFEYFDVLSRAHLTGNKYNNKISLRTVLFCLYIFLYKNQRPDRLIKNRPLLGAPISLFVIVNSVRFNDRFTQNLLTVYYHDTHRSAESIAKFSLLVYSFWAKTTITHVFTIQESNEYFSHT